MMNIDFIDCSSLQKTVEFDVIYGNNIVNVNCRFHCYQLAWGKAKSFQHKRDRRLLIYSTNIRSGSAYEKHISG